VIETLTTGRMTPSRYNSLQVDTSSVGRLLVLDGIIRPVVSVSITRSIPLQLVDYQSSRV
jgi:hypothetical protein